MNFARRSFLLAASALLGTPAIRAARSRITKQKVAAITDEIGATQSDAVAFAVQNGLQCVVLRHVPGSNREFASLTEPELKRHATELAANKLRVSLLSTGAAKPEAIAAAQILGADKIAVPAAAVEPLIPAAEKARIRLLIEAGTCAEIKAAMDRLPSKAVGFTWDPQEAVARGETPWSAGYALLPKARLFHVRIQAAGLAAGGPDHINWKVAMEALQKDGYAGDLSLATGSPRPAFEKTGDDIREVLHIVGQL